MHDHFVNGTLDDAYDLSPRPEFRRENLAENLAHLLESIVARDSAR
jgi:hypothetical protein